MTTLYIRSLNPETARRLKENARARGWTLATYLEALLALHAEARKWPEHSEELSGERVAIILESLGLNTVSH